jgi:hypothetical protein
LVKGIRVAVPPARTSKQELTKLFLIIFIYCDWSKLQIGLCMLIMYCAILVKVFISSKKFLYSL